VVTNVGGAGVGKSTVLKEITNQLESNQLRGVYFNFETTPAELNLKPTDKLMVLNEDYFTKFEDIEQIVKSLQNSDHKGVDYIIIDSLDNVEFVK
jgi:predicted ATP-dependent serine protease